MSEPTGCAGGCPRSDTYCDRCDVLVGLPGLHVIKVVADQGDQRLTVTVESPPGPMGCPRCGVIAASHGRRTVVLVDAPAFGRPVRVLWRKRSWRCREPACPARSFTEQDERVTRPRGLLTTRACWWAIGQLRAEHASILGLARQLGTTWPTVWSSIKPLLEKLADDPARFDGVTTLGVDEHIWHHVSERDRGPRALTGMVDLSRDQAGRTRARLLDLVPGRSGKAYTDWLSARGEAFRKRVQVATFDPFHGYKNAIDDQLDDAVSVLDAFHIVKLGSQAVDEVRRRVQQAIHDHRGRRDDPLYGIRNLLRCAEERLTERQNARLAKAIDADERHLEVFVAWQCAQQLRQVYHQPTPAAGLTLATKIIDSFPSCPIPEIARLGRTLKRWRAAFLAYFETEGANNGGTEAVNGLIELHRRIARGLRNRHNYRLRMLLIGGAFDKINTSDPPQV
jgi:transposase